ncbi:MAG: SdrD B-like domain-containing protein [Actinomycetota bacterium]
MFRRTTAAAIAGGLVLATASLHVQSVTVSAGAAGDPVTGTVFRDYDSNGARSSLEPGQAGIPVKAFDDTGASVSATTDATGAYSLDVSSLAGTRFRVEFGPLPSYLQSSRNGDNNATSVQFVDAGAAADYGVINPSEYCSENVEAATTCFVGGAVAPDGPAVVAFPQNAGITGITSNNGVASSSYGEGMASHADLAFENAVGPVRGLAWQRSSQTLFTSAYAKRHTAYPGGPNDNSPDTIWAIPRTGGGPVVFFRAEAGADLHNYSNLINDSGFWDQVGRSAWGDIDMSVDENTLYAANMFDRLIYAIPTSGIPATAGTATTIDLGPLASVDCGGNDWVPGGIKSKDDAVYFTATCTAATSQAAADLKGLVYRMDSGGALTRVANFPLNYARGPNTNTTPPALATWLPWTSVVSLQQIPGGGVYYPQPWLTDIEFDEGGNLLLGITDRSGDQFGYGAASSGLWSETGTASGDTVRLVPDAAPGTWVSNGTSGDFFNSEKYALGSGANGYHSEISLGHLAIRLGTGNLVTSAFDPAPISAAISTTDGATQLWPRAVQAGGLIGMSTTDGSRKQSYQLYGYNDPNSFGKAAGIGDIEYLCDNAPLEIGDYIWKDVDGDGIQDPTETPLAGVTARLYDDAGAVVETTTTDANGQYFFAVQPNTSYKVRFDNPDDYAAGGPLEGTRLTTADAGSNDNADSDATITDEYPEITVTTGAAGVTNHTLDAGFVPLPVTIGNEVWLDTNNDGVRQAEETPRPDVTVQLFLDANGDGELTGDEQTPVATAVTDVDGLYLFTEHTDADGTPLATAKLLTAGNYVVGIPAANFDAGGPLVGYHSSGASVDPTGAITDGIAGTGTQDNDDNGATQTTGFYAGGVLSASTEVKPGSAPTGEDPNNNDPSDFPDANSDLTIDFGFYTASLGNVVWGDNSASGSNNGIRDAGEDGISGIPVRLYSADGSTLIAETETGANGSYSFDGLAAGEYVIQIDAPAGYRSSADIGSTPAPDNGVESDDNGIGSADGTITSGPITITPGDSGAAGENVIDNDAGNTTNPTVDFGLVGTTGIGDYVWWDKNANGIQDAGEPGLPGVTVELFAADGTTPITANGLGLPVEPISTDTDGAYQFNDLSPGQYVVKFTPPAAWLPSPVGAGGDSALDSDGETATSATLAAGERDDTLDSGFIPEPAAVGDFVWQDRNGNGVQDSGEPGLAGVVVTLYEADGTTPVTEDVDGNPITPITTLTGGTYLFANLAPGDYVVKFEPPAGWEATATGAGSSTDDSDGLSVEATLTADEVNLTVDSGFVFPSVSVGDFVWLDANHDGIQDDGESGLGGVTITLYEADGTTPVTENGYGDPITPIVTQADGKYEFTNLPPGSYVVKFTPPPGDYEPTITGAGTAATDSNGLEATSGALAGGESDLTLDSGFWIPPVTIGDFVWLDADHNGVQDAGETGLAGVTVTLYEADGITPVAEDTFGNPIEPVVTAADGAYEFADLPPGQYVVKFTPPTGYEPTRTGQGTPGTDSNGLTAVSGVLASNEEDRTLDSGFWQPGSIGDVVWVDVNADGIKGLDEAGVSGVTVTLLNADGVVIATAMTDDDGRYEFIGLDPGTYTVKFTPPAGYILTFAGEGSDTVDSNPDQVTGITAPIELGPGQNDPSIDAGLVPTGTINGAVFVDADRDGRKDSGEAGIKGVTIELTGTDIFGNTITRTTTTGADGTYRFEDLPPGEYTIRQRQPNGYDDGTDSSGSGGSAGNDVITITLEPGAEVLASNNFAELPRPITPPGGGGGTDGGGPSNNGGGGSPSPNVPPGTKPANGWLPRTGSGSATSLLMLGLAMTLGGITAVIVGRRRRRET